MRVHYSAELLARIQLYLIFTAGLLRQVCSVGSTKSQRLIWKPDWPRCSSVRGHCLRFLYLQGGCLVFSVSHDPVSLPPSLICIVCELLSCYTRPGQAAVDLIRILIVEVFRALGWMRGRCITIITNRMEHSLPQSIYMYCIL